MDWHPLGHVLATGSTDFTTRFWARNRPADEDQSSGGAAGYGGGGGMGGGTYSRILERQEMKAARVPEVKPTAFDQSTSPHNTPISPRVIVETEHLTPSLLLPSRRDLDPARTERQPALEPIPVLLPGQQPSPRFQSQQQRSLITKQLPTAWLPASTATTTALVRRPRRVRPSAAFLRERTRRRSRAGSAGWAR